RRRYKTVEIRADLHQAGAVTLVIHELLHNLLDEQLEAAGFTQDVGEWMVHGLEQQMVGELEKMPREWAWWVRRINERIVTG
ncbi:MAG TPA: hypothetical protein VJ787_09555, partial [Thermoleophilia bacterium]|nr:hypothetical protein [Thermoleophilia bacterium]